MSGFDLALPQDVPWERIGAAPSLTEFATATPDGTGVVFAQDTPNVWKPSISIFAYAVPVENTPLYPDRRIIYLKIPVTLTGIRPIIHREDPGFQILSPTDGLRLQFEESTPYLPCHGALVHVTVHPAPVPKTKDWKQYPYFIDMEPKRKEIYQAVTESQQYLEGATSQLTFGKTAASEASTQAGFNFGTQGASSGDYSIPLQGGYSTGTTATQRAGANLNVDWSREKRETLSYTSQINQIHQVQVAYHLGGNRTFLAIQPRPGLDESEFVLVNGPRKIEGIQDFVLVVNAPASLCSICIQARVESAHIYAYDQSQTGALLIVSNEAQACLRLRADCDCEPAYVSIKETRDQATLKPLPGDVGVVYEREIPGPPRERARARPRDLMNAVNRYVEDYVTRGMLDSVLSSTRYRAPIAFAHTRAARAAVATLLRTLPQNDQRNSQLSLVKGLPAATRVAVGRAGATRLRDLFTPAVEKKAAVAGVAAELAAAQKKVTDEILGTAASAAR